MKKLALNSHIFVEPLIRTEPNYTFFRYVKIDDNELLSRLIAFAVKEMDEKAKAMHTSHLTAFAELWRLLSNVNCSFCTPTHCAATLTPH